MGITDTVRISKNPNTRHTILAMNTKMSTDERLRRITSTLITERITHEKLSTCTIKNQLRWSTIMARM